MKAKTPWHYLTHVDPLVLEEAKKDLSEEEMKKLTPAEWVQYLATIRYRKRMEKENNEPS